MPNNTAQLYGIYVPSMGSAHKWRLTWKAFEGEIADTLGEFLRRIFFSSHSDEIETETIEIKKQKEKHRHK